MGLAVNNTDNILVADNGNNRIQIFELMTTPIPSPMPTVTRVICDEAIAIVTSSTELTLRKQEISVITVTVTGNSNCPIAGDTVKVDVEKRREETHKSITKKQKTDKNSEAVFAVKVEDKTGGIRLTFKDSSLKTTAAAAVVL